MPEHVTVVVEGVDEHVGYSGLAKILRPRTYLFQEPVERDKLLA